MGQKDILTDFTKSLEEARDMILILGTDCKAHYDATQAPDSQLHRRAYVRAVFAFIEGVLHRTKTTTVHLGILLGNITIHELIVLEGAQLDVDQRGEIKDRPFYPNFLNNFKFTFKTYGKAFGSSFIPDYTGTGWQGIQTAVKVRDRLMHPKSVTDLEVSSDEIRTSKEAFDWFLINYNLSGHYAHRAIQLKSSANKNDIESVESMIHKLEIELVARGR